MAYMWGTMCGIGVDTGALACLLLMDHFELRDVHQGYARTAILQHVNSLVHRHHAGRTPALKGRCTRP